MIGGFPHRLFGRNLSILWLLRLIEARWDDPRQIYIFTPKSLSNFSYLALAR